MSLVMRRGSDVRAGVEKRLDGEEEARPDLVAPLKRDLLRLHVDALADAHARLEGRQGHRVVVRSAQHRLEHDADVVVALGVERSVDAQRRVRSRGVLHVETDEVLARPGGVEHAPQISEAGFLVDLEPERRRLDAQARREAFAVDSLEDAHVQIGVLGRLLHARHLFAEQVERRELALRVQAADDDHRVIEGLACDVAGGDPADDRPWHVRKRANDGTVDQGHAPGNLPQCSYAVSS